MPADTTVRALLARYDAILLDAYGVLNDSEGPLPGAAAFIDALADRPWALCTNDASRLPAVISARLGGFGITVPAERVVSAGELLAPHFAARGLAGQPCVVLGTGDSHRYVRDAGGVLVEPGDAVVRTIVLADDGFEPFKDLLEAAINVAARTLAAGAPLDLVLPNPDVIYPRPRGEIGLGAGSLQALFEAALDRRHPGAPRFVPLGKPEPAMFTEARRRLGLAADAKVVMIGDQLDTDIAGALAAGIDAALVAGGVSTWHEGLAPAPTWLLPSLMLDP